MPKFSIITINYNNKAGLEKTIQSVVGQTYRDFEYIIIDGGSNDGSVEVIKQYSEKITKWISEKDTGIYNAMNKGISLAKGEYCLFLNSGDYLYKANVLESVFKKSYQEDIIYGDMIIEQVNGKRTLGKMPEKLSFEHMIQDTLWHPVAFIKRDLFAVYGLYREDLKIVSDYDFLLKAIVVNKVSTRHIAMPFSVFLIDGMSSKPENSEMIKRERKMVQLQYFKQAEIDAVPPKQEPGKSFLYKVLHRLKG